MVILQSRVALAGSMVFQSPPKAMQAPLAKSLLEVDGVREVRQCGGGLDHGAKTWWEKWQDLSLDRSYFWMTPNSNWEWNGPSDGKTQQESCRQNINLHFGFCTNNFTQGDLPKKLIFEIQLFKSTVGQNFKRIESRVAISYCKRTR